MQFLLITLGLIAAGILIAGIRNPAFWYAEDGETQRKHVRITSVFVAILLGAAFLAGGGNTDTAQKQEKPDKTDACVMSQSFVEQFLKAPDNAEFQWCSDASKEKIGTNEYRIVSYVDATNSFNASIRTQYEAHVKHAGEQNWDLLYLSIDGKEIITRK